MNVDRWSFSVAKDILKDECHVEGRYKLWWYKPDFDTYKIIVNDKGAYQVSKYATKMNTDVQLFVEHSSKGTTGNNASYVEVGNSCEVAGGDANYVEGGGGDEDEHDSGEDMANGISFDDSEDERALGLDDGFNVVIEPPNPPKNADVTGAKKSNKKPVSKKKSQGKTKVRKPKKNAIVEPAQDPNTSAAPPEVPNVDDDVEFEMLAADLAAAFEPTQTQPTVNAVTNDVVPNASVMTKCNTLALTNADPDGDIISSADDFILSQPVESDVPASQKKKTTKVVHHSSTDEFGASSNPEVLKPKKKTRKKVVRQIDPKNLRRSDRTRTLRCKNFKGPGSDPSQPLTFDDELDEGNEEPTVRQDDHPSSQPSFIDPKIGGCLGALRGWGFISGRCTQ
ncbi:unnamed protein product [Trifolium pratense]|uniref:Uncharacterized protein n=1 Tax=Trifolium pratense TaxID=57577 RepID=A0ACB0KNJ2_TRIPR|nr:unnamed protein product [Trifolium pratense]